MPHPTFWSGNLDHLQLHSHISTTNLCSSPFFAAPLPLRSLFTTLARVDDLLGSERRGEDRPVKLDLDSFDFFAEKMRPKNR